MFWRCIHDHMWSYCSGEPDGVSNASMSTIAGKEMNLGVGATCSLNPKTCGKRLTSNQVHPEKESLWQEPSTLVTKIMVDKKAKKDKGEQGAMI